VIKELSLPKTSSAICHVWGFQPGRRASSYFKNRGVDVYRYRYGYDGDGCVNLFVCLSQKIQKASGLSLRQFHDMDPDVLV
jgi:hypothetical protein